METRWADFGYIGSILLLLYGLLFFIAYNLSPVLLGTLGGTILSVLLGLLAFFGGILFSCAFFAFRTELKVSWAWLPFLTGVVVWAVQGVAQILVGFNHPVGITLYGWTVILLVLLFLIWGAFLFTMRKLLGRKSRLGLFASILFLINCLGWLSVFGFGILVCTMVLMAIILVPEKQLLPLFSLRDFFSQTRKSTLAHLGGLVLTLYSIIALKWEINGFFPLPVLPAAILNFISVLAIWIAVPALILLFLNIEEQYNNPFSYYAIVVGAPALLLLSVTDFTWLMSNINVFVDPVWGLEQYNTLPLIWSWSNILLFLWCLLAAIAFLQLYRLPQNKGDFEFLLIHLMFLLAAILWIFGIGYLTLILAGVLLYRKKFVKR